MSKKGFNIFLVRGIKRIWIVSTLILLMCGVVRADTSLQTLRCDSGTTVIGNSGESTNFICTTAGVPLETGLLGNTTTSAAQYVRVATAAYGPWILAHFINNSAFPSYVNITADSASISMRMGATGTNKRVYGFYELGFYDPDGMPGNFVSLFKSTAASSTTITQTSYPVSFNGQSGIIPAGDKLAVRVWMNSTNVTDRPYFDAYSNSGTLNSSFVINMEPLPTYWISGYVIDESSGEAITGAVVRTNSSVSARTNAFGYYTIPVINGTYIVSARNDTYFANSTLTSLDGSNVTNVNISILPSSSPAWRIRFDPRIDQPANDSTGFTPKVWLYSQDNFLLSGQNVSCSYFNVNENILAAPPCIVTDNLDGSYSGSQIDMTLYKNKYINVLFQVYRGAGSNPLREQHSFFSGESNPAHGAVWKIEVMNTSIGPYFNGSRSQRIYIKLYSDAALPFKNNQNTNRYTVKNSSGGTTQSGFMTYEEDGIYSFITNSNYINNEKYYFELVSNWSGRPTGSTGTGGTALRNTSAFTGLYLQANNSLIDNVFPEIAAIKRKPYFPVDDEFVTVTVDAFDNNDIVSAHLHYSVNHGLNYSILMDKQAGLEYSAQIPVYLLEDNVRYWIDVEDEINEVISEEFMYNVQDHRGNPNMSHSFLSHPVYWIGKSRQANFLDYGGILLNGSYSTTYKDGIAYLSTPNDYQYFKDMTRIKVQTLIMDETGKPIQHLDTVRAWLSNNSQQDPGTHNLEKIMTEVPGDPGVYTVTWEGSPDKNYVNTSCCFTWSEDSKSIWANYTSGEKYSVFIDANNDSIPEENITWLAYNFGDTMWGASGISRTFANHSNMESVNSCSYGSCHMMVRDINNRSIPGPACPDCHGVFKDANDSNWPINGITAEINDILYGNSTAHPRQSLTNTILCGDESCHNWQGTVANKFPTSNAYMEIPGYPFATRINQTFRSTYPNPMQCAEHHDYKQTKIPLEEGHNKMVGCKYCHGGSHSNFKLKDFDIEAMGTIPTIEKGTPGYVGTEGVNGSGTYAGDCYKDCHRVQVEHSLIGMPGGATQNAFVPCDECHENFNNAPMHQESLFPYPDREWCGTCHQAQGNITSHNTSNPLNPPRIPATQQHAQETGIRWNSSGKRPYWVENEQSCRFCHGRSYNEAYGLGRIEKFLGTKTINGSINSTSFWCSSCHVNTSSQNYENMVNVYNYSFGVVPPEITGSTWRSDRGGYFDHDETNIINASNPATYYDERCFTCHGGNLSQSVSMDVLIHDVNQARANPDCISCHNIGGNASRHVNFSAMDNSEVFHRNLNSNASSGGLSDKNKKCWACHGIIVNGYANESDQPQDTHTPDWNPKKCPDCHTTGLFYAPNVTDHIPSGYAPGTDLKTGSYCSSCHNNSFNNGMGIVEVEHENASVSHYGTKKNLIDTIGTMNASQGCVYCHYDPVIAAIWGNASDPRTSTKRPHSETRNSQCMGCHLKGTTLPTTFHNETLFARVSGGSPPPVPSGSSKILVATNRYVIIDDPITGTAYTAGGFANPFYSYPTWTIFTGKNTLINATALFLDESGSPQNGKIVTFNLYDPSGTEYTIAQKDATTDSNGLASFSFDMNSKNYYGNWTVKASSGDINDNTGFIYNWIGCAYNSGTCSYNHNTRTFPTTATVNSPYTSGRDAVVGSRSTHYGSTVNCTWCHQSYDGTSGDTNPATGDAKHLNVPSDVHRNIACSDVNCHNTLTTHRTGAVISSCYSAACHTPADRSDISNKSTLDSSNIATALSLYSINSTAFNATFHTPDSTIPCIICHGPMHNISKPDKTQRFIRNSDTESSQCATCHINSSHSQNIDNCTLCHGSDVHALEYITNQTTSTVANYSHNRSSAAGCKDCHNNTGINSYFAGKGYDPKKNDSYGFDLTDHNNIVNCNACHDRLHWTGYLNSTGQYQKSSSGSIECRDCHSGTNDNVSNTNAYWGYITPSRSMHNDSVSCESCHFASKHGIRFLQQDMVSFGSKITSATCVNCHQQGYQGAPLIPAPVNHSTNSYSGSLWNGAQQSFWDNSSQLSSCNYCHGADLHSASGLGEINRVKGTNNINQSLTNGYWCANCHYKNAPDYAGNQFTVQPPEVLNSYGLVPTMAHDGTSFYNHSNDLSSGYDDEKCKTCHDNNLLAGATSLNFTHNAGTGSSGGRNCIACHNISSPGTYPKVNFSAINLSVHGNLNEQASSSPEYSLNKPCWGCHGTVNGTFANESDQPESGHNTSVYKSPRKCDECHITGQLMFTTRNVTDHISSGYTQETDVNTSSYNPGYCTYCHNNSVNNGFEPDSMGIFGGSPINASVSHYGANKTGNLLMAPGINSTDCVFCHRNSSNMVAWGILPQSSANINNKNASGGGTDHSEYISSSQCSVCHGGYTITSAFTFHDSALGNGSGGAGGPNCKMCHDINGAQKKVNFSAMNDTDSIHKNLNNEAFSSDNAYNESKKCWACHGNGSEPQGHPTNYKSPSNCTDCHTNSSSQFAGLQVSGHYWNSTSIKTPAADNCYICHNTTEMIIPAYDPDGRGSIYSGANGGNDSVSHYGKRRQDYQSIQDTNDYCYQCHNNVSTVFPFIDTNNKTIANHSVNYPSTNPGCSDCHSTGRIHNSTLTNPSFSLPNSTFCETCHGPTGSAAIKDKVKHNGTVECSQCHMNSSRSIHPVRYLQQDMTSWNTVKTNAVNCTNCHEEGFANAPIIPDPSKHSNNVSNGSLWKNTPYWTSESGSCYYCHDNTNHNSTALGKISSLLTDLNNTRKGQLTTTTWCADCHYNGTSNPDYKGNLWNPIPPLITLNNTDNDYWLNHTGYLDAGYGDSVCETCHAINGNSSLDSMNYSHSLDEGTNGGPDCISCHDIGGSAGAGKRVNFSVMGNSGAIHSSLNNNATTGLSAENKKCWACHGDGSEPEASGHPANYKTPFKCDKCHVPGPGQNLNFTPADTLMNVTEHYWNGTSIGTSAINTCYDCHNTGEMMMGSNPDPDGAGSIYGGANGGSTSTSHYGKKRPDYQSIQGTNDYCTRCHNNLSTVFPFIDTNNKTISNHSVNYPSTNPGCTDCHSTGRIHDNTLANPKFNLPNSSYCETCHGLSGSASIKDKEKHNGSVDCTQCHLNSSRSIHPVQYLQQDTTSWNSSKTNAVNCTDCHGSGFANAPVIPDPSKHSNNVSNGSLWNDTAYWTTGSGSCYYCHNNTNHNSIAIGTISNLLTNPNNTRKGQLTTTTWCADCHYNDAANPFYKGDQWYPIPPLITVNNTNKENWKNHTNYFGTGYSDIVCENCHVLNGNSSLDSTNYSHSLNEGTVGGPDCISCHSTALGGGKQVNLSAMNDSEAIHKNLNSNASNGGLSDENKKCWACHSNGSTPSIGHPSNFRTPYKCENCHVPGPDQNFNFTPSNTVLNVTEHYWNGTGIGTAAITTCYGCHNTGEMMLGSNLDPDGAGSVYGGANGGSGSTSHYGRKRPDYQSIQGTNDYCYSCHNNLSTVFPFIDTNNKTISNHSVNYPSTNPGCTDCHSTGRIHDNTLANPKFNLPNSSYCETCHGFSGSASIKDKEKHNGSVDCTQCHLNSSRSIHPVQYLQQDTTSWDSSKTNAVNCTDCHRSGFANAPVIPDPSKHSNNVSNGSIWNNTAYWTTISGSCYYCHNNTNHNSTAIGKISILSTNPNNSMKGQLTTTTWCADCHYNDVSNSFYKGDQWNPIPPLINVNNTNRDNWVNHSGYFGTGYSDSSCENCHAINGSSSKDSLNYSHSLDAGMGGGPDCISCHDIGGLAPETVNVTDLGKGVHKNLNGAAANANLSCYACHGDGSAPASGHPVEYKTPKKCAECHSQGNYSAQIISNHIPPKLANDPGRIISTNAYCTGCHNNSLNNFAYTINGSVSHYGTNDSILKPTVNQTALPVFGFFDMTEAQDHNKECNSCHKNYPFNLTYGNATQTEYGHTSIAACDQCHLKASASDLHNGSVIMPETFSCLDCHTIYASKYKAPNMTGTNMATYPSTSCDSGGCHGQSATNGLLDTLNKHNTNLNYSGTPGNTGLVYLNGQNSITVNNGTQVLITSMINDISGGSYYASRVGLSEYYLDTDPGLGKGIGLNAVDGQYDAVDGAWENVNATIDTTNLSVGMHKIYVRGMDIGKQWSATQNASLTIKSSIPYVPPAPVSLESKQGNFWINYTWQAGIGNISESFNVSVNGSWTNGTVPNYSNNSAGPHGWRNISVWAYNNSGNGSLSQAAASNNTQVANNNPVQSQAGNKTVAEGNLLTFTISATDLDSDILVNGTNATKGTFNPVTNQFNWTPGYGDQGTYFLNFNSSDNYGGTTNQTITVTVNNIPLSITTSTPVTDPTSTESAIQSFTINLNRTSNVTWYMNGSIVRTNTSVISSNYANSTASIGVYNVTAIATDGFDTIVRKWNWTVTAIPTYQVSGYVFDNYGIGLVDVLVQNATNQDATSASGQYSITGLINGTYNFSFSKTGFNTEYQDLTINGADITNANKSIFDTTPLGQVTGLLNDTPALTTVNLSWDLTAEANYYQVFRNTGSLGYTQNTYWNDTGLNSSTLYQYMVRANDTYDNWGQNSSILNVTTATPDTTPPASISDINLITGNFYINNTWVNPFDVDLDYIWFRNSNGTTLQNVSKPATYLNLSYSVRYTQNISAQTVDTLGNTNQTQIWFNTTIPNNPPVQSPIGSKTINENQLLQINVTATDIDSDQIIYGTDVTKGTFNTSTGQFSWKPVLGEAGIYVWYFNSSDSYGGFANETITVTVNPDPLGNCLSCHNSIQSGNPAIIQPSFGNHMNVNTAEGRGILNNSDCITCHYDFSNMLQAGFTTGTRTCLDCHTLGNFSAPIIRNHMPGGVNISTTAYCSKCHINSISIYANDSNTSVAHYATNASLIKPTVNRTIEPVFGFMIPQEASDYNRECSNCHNPSNESYGNATLITMGHTSTATCNQCHLNADANNLHNGSFIKPVTSNCKACHTIYADIYKAPNLTNTTHKNYDCSYSCHVQPDYSPQGRLDPPDHNTDFTLSPGNKPTTDLVSLNGSSSLTVYKGETVTVSSRIYDNPYTASRVRGAEYYIDSDPGSGKGIPMNANDGYFDASNGAWENITGSIDTLNLTVNTHTVYVRGMDIGKQWSTSVAATLIVLDSNGFVNGTVRNSSGSVITGATVITNTGESAITDSNGSYSLYLIIGTYDLTAIKEPEFYSNNTFASVNVTNSATEIREAILAEKPTGTVSGVITN